MIKSLFVIAVGVVIFLCPISYESYKRTEDIQDWAKKKYNVRTPGSHAFSSYKSFKILSRISGSLIIIIGILVLIIHI